ncbi:hypothetical protein ACFQX6_06110 [Streptosporangium lutulentum]
MEVAGGHTLDALEHLLGGITELSAGLSIRRSRQTVPETGETLEVTSPDQIVLHATLAGGAVVSAHIHDAKATDGRTRFEITGTEGDLAIVSGAGGPGGIQMSELRLLGAQGVGGSWQELLPRTGTAGFPGRPTESRSSTWRRPTRGSPMTCVPAPVPRRISTMDCGCTACSTPYGCPPRPAPDDPFHERTNTASGFMMNSGRRRPLSAEPQWCRLRPAGGGGRARRRVEDPIVPVSAAPPCFAQDAFALEPGLLWRALLGVILDYL